MMKAVCIENHVNEDVLGPAWQRISTSVTLPEYQELSIGVEYVVCALEQWSDGGVWIYLRSVETLPFPSPYPAELFRFTDARVPEGWSLKIGSDELGSRIQRISFIEWANDDSFYERLIDGDDGAYDAFRRRCPDAR